MSSCDPFRQNHKRFIVDTLVNQYSDISDDNLYLSIGKITPWGATQGSDIPVRSLDSVEDDTNFWRGMIAAKRINRSDVSFVIRRVDWTSGTVYTAYRNNVDLFDDLSPADFYALVDEERVYICIDNNLGSQSLIPPTHTDSIVRKLSDGYRWKFLYQIPESKRKFLTKSKVGSIGYMPVEFVESIRENDDRVLQWNVQQAAVNGKIEFAYMDEPAKAYWVSSPSCVLPSNANIVVDNVASGGTTVQISSPELSPNSDFYTNMIISFDAGPGQGQRRTIKEYNWLGVTARVVVDPLVLGISGSSNPNTQTFFSIQPKVTVNGDGFANSNTYNPTNRTADFQVKFGETAGVSADCSNILSRYVKSIEIVDGGKDYTFIELDIPKGLTTVFSNTPREYLDLKKVLHGVIPPPGGHGANPFKELGCAAYMIVKDFDGDELVQGNCAEGCTETSKLDTDNDFRQFGIIRNPTLSNPQTRLKFFQIGLTGTFTVGGTAGQLGTSIVGRVLEWNIGTTGVTATSELVLDRIVGGTFAAGATVGGLTVYDVSHKTVAGTEGRHLMRLILSPQNIEFASSGKTYARRHYAHGVGNRSENIPESRSSGEIYKWQTAAGTLQRGVLHLEDPKGKFNIGELVLQTQPYFAGSNGSTGDGKIVSIDTELINVPSIYDLTTTLKLFGEDFVKDTFYKDAFVSFATGITAGNGYVVDWNPVTGGTNGYLRLAGAQGIFVTGQAVEYIAFGSSGNTTSVDAIVQSIDHRGELKYRTGEVLYIQNIKPIQRDLEQREEIKLVIEL